MIENQYADIEYYFETHPGKYESFAKLRNKGWDYVLDKLNMKPGQQYNGPRDTKYISLKSFYLLQNYGGTSCKSYMSMFNDVFIQADEQYVTAELYVEILNVIEDFKTMCYDQESIDEYIECLIYGYKREVELFDRQHSVILNTINTL